MIAADSIIRPHPFEAGRVRGRPDLCGPRATIAAHGRIDPRTVPHEDGCDGWRVLYATGDDGRRVAVRNLDGSIAEELCTGECLDLGRLP